MTSRVGVRRGREVINKSKEEVQRGDVERWVVRGERGGVFRAEGAGKLERRV